MSRHTRRRSPAPALWALIAIFGLPALAEAQLFPNAAIHRKRVPCCQEPPVYKMYREQFYGHYPTCWRQWPSGWGCPTPEAPPQWDIVQREDPIRSERDVQIPSLDASLPASGGPPAANLPLPDAGSPFEMPDSSRQPAQEPSGLNPPAQRQPEPSPFDLNPPTPNQPEPSPFDLPQTSLPVPGGIELDRALPELAPPGGIAYASEAPPQPIEAFGPLVPMLPDPGLSPTNRFEVPEYVVDRVPPQPSEMDELNQRAPRRGVVAGMVDRFKSRMR